MLEAVRVARAGFPVRYTHEQFTSRYAPLARRRHLRQEDDNTGSAAAAAAAGGAAGSPTRDGYSQWVDKTTRSLRDACHL